MAGPPPPWQLLVRVAETENTMSHRSRTRSARVRRVEDRYKKQRSGPRGPSQNGPRFDGLCKMKIEEDINHIFCSIASCFVVLQTAYGSTKRVITQATLLIALKIGYNDQLITFIFRERKFFMENKTIFSFIE